MEIKTNNKELKKFLELFGISMDPIIGIDLGSSAVKIMELSKENDRYVVQNFAIEPLNMGDIVEKNIKNKDAVIKALSKAMAKTKISSRLACVSIPSAVAITKTIQLENGISEREVVNEIELEADRYIPYQLEEVNLDFEIIGSSKIGNNLMDVLLVATKKENVKTRVSILESIGIRPKIIDVESLSLERVFNKLIAKDLPNGGRDQLIALFDIGATSTSLNIFYDLRLIYTKDQPFGGQQLLDEIQKRYGLTLQEAVLARKYNDLPDDYMVDVLDPYRKKIAQQIIRTSQLFLSSSEHNKIDYVCLSGGTSNLPGLDDIVQELLHVKAIVVNPFTNLLVADHVSAEILAEESLGLLNCCGLALRNFKDPL